MRHPSLLAGLILLAPISAFCDDDAKLQEIIEQVRRNEQLYDNLEVEMHSVWEHAPVAAPDPNPKPAARLADFGGLGGQAGAGVQTMLIDVRKHSICVGGRFFVESQAKTRNSEGAEFNHRRVWVCDGTVTRASEQSEQNSKGTLFRKRDSAHCIRPHLLLLLEYFDLDSLLVSPSTRVSVPLSVYLSGRKAIGAHPDAIHLLEDRTMQVVYEGTAEFNGLKCHKVYVEMTYKGNRTTGRVLWLAEDRNYLPVRALRFSLGVEEPLGRSTVNKLREIQPGVWFPIEMETVQFDTEAMLKEDRRDLLWRERRVIEKVNLNPEIDPEIFLSFKYPEGQPVSEYKDGKVIARGLGADPDPATLTNPKEQPKQPGF